MMLTLVFCGSVNLRLHKCNLKFTKPQNMSVILNKNFSNSNVKQVRQIMRKFSRFRGVLLNGRIVPVINMRLLTERPEENDFKQKNEL